MKKLLFLLTLCVMVVTSCKKEEPEPPTNNPNLRVLTSYEADLVGDWILKRTEYYNSNDSLIATTNHNNPTMCHILLKETAFAGGTSQAPWDGIIGITCSPVSQAWGCESGAILTLGTMSCPIVYQTTDSLILAYGNPMSKFYLKK